jgi:hypothetical protein
MLSVTYRSTGPVPEYPELIGYTGMFETDDLLVFGYVLGEIEEREDLTLISVDYGGRPVPVFGPHVSFTNKG